MTMDPLPPSLKSASSESGPLCLSPSPLNSNPLRYHLSRSTRYIGSHASVREIGALSRLQYSLTVTNQYRSMLVNLMLPVVFLDAGLGSPVLQRRPPPPQPPWPRTRSQRLPGETSTIQTLYHPDALPRACKTSSRLWRRGGRRRGNRGEEMDPAAIEVRGVVTLRLSAGGWPIHPSGERFTNSCMNHTSIPVSSIFGPISEPNLPPSLAPLLRTPMPMLYSEPTKSSLSVYQMTPTGTSQRATGYPSIYAYIDSSGSQQRLLYMPVILNTSRRHFGQQVPIPAQPSVRLHSHPARQHLRVTSRARSVLPPFASSHLPALTHALEKVARTQRAQTSRRTEYLREREPPPLSTLSLLRPPQRKASLCSCHTRSRKIAVWIRSSGALSTDKTDPPPPPYRPPYPFREKRLSEGAGTSSGSERGMHKTYSRKSAKSGSKDRKKDRDKKVKKKREGLVTERLEKLASPAQDAKAEQMYIRLPSRRNLRLRLNPPFPLRRRRATTIVESPSPYSAVHRSLSSPPTLQALKSTPTAPRNNVPLSSDAILAGPLLVNRHRRPPSPQLRPSLTSEARASAPVPPSSTFVDAVASRLSTSQPQSAPAAGWRAPLVSSASLKSDLASGQARLRDLISRYQGRPRDFLGVDDFYDIGAVFMFFLVPG
ncbi:hypothetical protein EI94DRAFT_1803018 [Lactarius quietus]|nr:hypothetical protein EI94DRAFT_1803018 [Lactarius quietus]